MNIGWSKFASHRHQPGMGFSYFDDTDKELFKLIRENWDKREIGQGATSADDVCIIPVPADKFMTASIPVDKVLDLYAYTTKRQPKEHSFVKVGATGPTVECKFAKVVLYAAHELLKNGGERSTDADWEIVCLIASNVEEEPMHPLACARNMLGKPGGTPREYTAEYLCKSIWYWSQYVSVIPSEIKKELDKF